MDNIHTEDETRPWGGFEVFAKNEPVTVKIITVKHGEKLSLQYHNHRSEFWRILSGNPEITVGEKIIRAQNGDEFKIPVGSIHRISAPEGDAEILEIGFGIFDEQNDIVRIEDAYGRK